MLTALQTVSWFIFSCSNCVHWTKMSEMFWPLCFSNWDFCSRNVLHWLICAVFSESVICIGTGVYLSNSPSDILFSNISSFMGASESTIGVELIASCRTIVLDSIADCIFACLLPTIDSQRACLMIMSSVCTGYVMVTVDLLCSSLLTSCLYFVPTYCSIFPCWCPSNMLQICVHNLKYCLSGRCTNLSYMYWC